MSGASQVPSDEAGMRRFERPDQLPPRLRSTRTYVFTGGCVTYRLEFDSTDTAPLLFDIDAALAFQARACARRRPSTIATICGCAVSAPPCPGGS